MACYLLKTDVNVPLPTIRNKQKKSWKKPLFYDTLKAIAYKSRIRIGCRFPIPDQELDRIRNPEYGYKDPDPYQNVTDPEYCSLLNSVMHTKTIAVRTGGGG
jgi:hypothetical protein